MTAHITTAKEAMLIRRMMPMGILMNPKTMYSAIKTALITIRLAVNLVFFIKVPPEYRLVNQWAAENKNPMPKA
jgi:hypothetical protein